MARNSAASHLRRRWKLKPAAARMAQTPGHLGALFSKMAGCEMARFDLAEFGHLLGANGERNVLMASETAPPRGCVFRTRCRLTQAICGEQVPEFREVKAGHFAACHFAE